jgi:hypothetical protein
MKLFLIGCLIATTIPSFAAQIAGKDQNCCKTCDTAEAIACRGMAQKRPRKHEKPSGSVEGKGRKNKSKSQQGSQS